MTMDATLQTLWTASWSSPFVPAVGKESQFTVGFSLVSLAIFLAGFFALNRSLLSLPLLAIPSSAALGLGVVYMFCAVGVYV